MTLHLALFKVCDHPRPGVFSFPRHDRIRVLQRLVSAVRRMHAAQDNLHATLAKFRGQLIGPRGVTGHDRNTDKIGGIIQIDVSDRLVLDFDVPA